MKRIPKREVVRWGLMPLLLAGATSCAIQKTVSNMPGVAAPVGPASGDSAENVGVSGPFFGRIAAIDLERKTVTVGRWLVPDGPSELVVRIGGGTVIRQNQQRRGLGDLKVGQMVEATAANGTATLIAVCSGADLAQRILPDRSEGLAGLIGPFFWGRAADLGADARFCDEYGRLDTEGEFLWLHQFKRGGRSSPSCIQLHERNNLVSRDPRIGYAVQPRLIRTNTPQGFQALKLMFGYVERDYKFLHGDNRDLVHIAATRRVCVMVPLKRLKPAPVHDQTGYVVDASFDHPPFGVFELDSGEVISSGGVGGLAHRILLDLREAVKGDATMYPGVSHPFFQFAIGGGGKWTLKIRKDGRAGWPGETNDAPWDMTFTESSPGAKPATLGLTPENSAWAMSVFNPGGASESSEIVVGLKPFERATGRPAPWPSRLPRITSCPVETLAGIGAREDVPSHDANGRLQVGKTPKK
jgi:hypothetical protein